MILGNMFDLRKPDAVIMDLEGYKLLWPDEEPRIGKRFEMNDHEAEIVGICKASRTFQTFPVVYTRYSQALEFVPPERKVLSFVLADAAPGANVDEVCRRIEEQTGLRAVTGQQFEWITMMYFMRKTGIPFNFGITVALGFIVGTAIAAQTFYLFTIENIKQYGALKAMGAGNLALDEHDPAAGAVGELDRLWAGDRRGGVVRHDCQRARLAAGVLHAVGSVRRHGAGRGGDQHAVESVEHAAGDGGRTGRRVSRVDGDERRSTDNPLVTCRDVVKIYGSGNAEVHALRGVDLDVYPGELTMLVGPERLRQDDAALGGGGNSAADQRHASTRWAPT